MTTLRPDPGPAESGTEADILATAHRLGRALHGVGALDAAGMEALDQLCLPPRPAYDGAEVRRIRAATGLSQPLFARLLGVAKSAVAQWERGAKRPSGPAQRLLEMLDPEQPESPVVRVRRGIKTA
ncbi:MAG: helix-turn-helix domain-containing protein [Acetobacteraceae bacterium]